MRSTILLVASTLLFAFIAPAPSWAQDEEITPAERDDLIAHISGFWKE